MLLFVVVVFVVSFVSVAVVVSCFVCVIACLSLFDLVGRCCLRFVVAC